MALTNAGRDHIGQEIVGESVTPFSPANAYIGVGNSTTVFAATQTALQGASQLRRGMNPSYPQRATNVLTFQATFLEAEANFVWAEVGVFNAVTGGTMLSRKVQALGTKPSTEQWKITATLPLAAS